MSGKNWSNNLPQNIISYLFGLNSRVVLCRDHHRINPDRLPVNIFYGHLGLAVGPQIPESPVLPDFAQPSRKTVRQCYGQGEKLLCLVTGITHHHSLVPCANLVYLFFGHFALPQFKGTVNALTDIGGLFIDSGNDGTGVSVKTVLGPGITDILNDTPRKPGNIHVALRCYFAGHYHEAGGNEGLTGDPPHRVFFQDCVQNSVRDLVGQLVRMTLRDRFG